MTAPETLKPGAWLGLDLGSRRSKVCSFCLLESGAGGRVTVSFERGPAQAPYPELNTRDALLDASRPPTYLRQDVEAEIVRILETSELLARLDAAVAAGVPHAAIAVDAPVAFAEEGTSRLTERASTQTFATPTRQVFEQLIAEKEDPFLRVNIFWKCVGLAVYSHLGRRFEPKSGGALEVVAAWTAGTDPEDSRPRLRETFPSDVYKRSNGKVATLAAEARGVLGSLVATAATWSATGEKERHPAAATLGRLEEIRRELQGQIDTGAEALDAMRKHPGGYGDLWDAFTCAFTACCEDHGAGVLHGPGTGDEAASGRLRREGAILTVAAG